jgi:hypothetical protein
MQVPFGVRRQVSTTPQNTVLQSTIKFNFSNPYRMNTRRREHVVPDEGSMSHDASLCGDSRAIPPRLVESGEHVHVIGVVVKVRKASRTLAFLSIDAHKLDVHDGCGELEMCETSNLAPQTKAHGEFPQVQAVLHSASQEEGWRSVFGSSGPRLCCGSVVSFWGKVEHVETKSPCAASKFSSLRPTSVLVHGGEVQGSPHDDMTASGGVKQHATVERSAAAAALRRRRGEGDRNADRQSELGDGPCEEGIGTEVVPICRQWWKSQVDGTLCTCSEGGATDRKEKTEAEQATRTEGIGLCGRRHFYLNASERDKFRILQGKRADMRQREAAAIADDPHSAQDKVTPSSLPLPQPSSCQPPLPFSLSNLPPPFARFHTSVPALQASKTKSDEMFVEWLVATFGEEYLRSGGGVVDVAGGRGDSFNPESSTLSPEP